MIDKPTRQVVVQEIINDTSTVKRFVLAPFDGVPLAGFTSGSHLTVFLQSAQEKWERHYSLYSDPDDPTVYEIAVRLAPESRGGSRYLHEQIAIGDVLTISQPKNHFPLSQRAAHHVLVAGGIGITPLYSMAMTLQRLGRSFEWHYAARSVEECALYEPVRQLAPETQFYFSTGVDARRLRPELVLAGQRVGTHLYICGPASLIADFRAAAQKAGYPASHIHYENFQALQFADNRSFFVRLKQTGAVLEIGQHESLLDGLARHGIQLPSSCRIGGCGTCEVAVCSGEIEHRDFVLRAAEQAENRSIISCVSRAKERIIELDL